MSQTDDPTGADEPLMRSEDENVNHPQNFDSHPTTPTSFRTTSKTIRFLTLSAGISGLLFGFDTGVISSTLVSIGSDLSNRPLTTPDKSLVTAITSLLALVSAPTTGLLADRYGRKSAILLPALLFTLGALIQAFATYVWTMALGRALVGAAVGVASGAVPLYITELAPAELRGRLVTVQSLFVTGGQVVAYLVGWVFASWPHGWRWMVGLGAAPAVVQVVLLVWMPETPRWLMQIGEEERARAVLVKVYAKLGEGEREEVVGRVLASIREEMRAESKILRSDDEGESRNGFRLAMRELIGVPANRRALTIACMLQAIQQLCGFNSLMYFSATIFSLAGFRSPIATSLSIALTNFAFTLLAFAFIDAIGRRAILLRSIPFMALSLAISSLAFLWVPITEAQTWAIYTPPPSTSTLWPAILLISIIAYVAAYALGLGCVPWQQSELFPLRVRSLGSGLATATNWGSNFVVGVTFLPMMGVLGASVTFAAYAGVCVLGWAAIWRVYPETAGLELEGVGEVLREGWGVEESVVRFRAWRRGVEESAEGEAG